MSSVKKLDLNEIRWDNIGSEPSTERKDDGRDQFDRVPAEEYNWYRNKMDTFVTAVVNAIRNSFSANLAAYYGNTKLGDDGQDETLWTGGTPVADTINKVLGSQSIQFTTVIGAMTPDKNNISPAIDFEKLNSGEISTSDDFIVVDMNFTTSANITSVHFRLSSDAVLAGNYVEGTLVSLEDRFKQYAIKKSTLVTAGSGATLNNIQSIGLKIISTDVQDINFQYAQLVKKDSVLDIPNPFQRFGINDYEINSGEWLMIKEFGIITRKELGVATDSIAALVGNTLFDDFIIDAKISSGGSSDIYGVAAYNSATNYILARIQNDILQLRSVESGITADEDVISLLIDDKDVVEFNMVKCGTDVILIAYLNNDYNNPYELSITSNLSDMKLALGARGSNVIQSYFTDSITEISYAAKAGTAEVARDVINTWLDYVPTLIFTGTPPASITTIARYRQIGNKIDFNISLSSADGNGAIDLRVSLPVVPKDNDSVISASSQEKVNTTWSNPIAYIDDDAGLGVQFRNFSTATDAVAWEMIITGSYEV